MFIIYEMLFNEDKMHKSASKQYQGYEAMLHTHGIRHKQDLTNLIDAHNFIHIPTNSIHSLSNRVFSIADYYNNHKSYVIWKP